MFGQGFCQSGNIALTKQRENIQMLQCTVLDVVTRFKGEQLIALDVRVVVAHDNF